MVSIDGREEGEERKIVTREALKKETEIRRFSEKTRREAEGTLREEHQEAVDRAAADNQANREGLCFL